MEIVTLNSAFEPDTIVENYEAAVFTERYNTYGDFIVRGSNIDVLVDLLPRKSYISCRESSVPMIVEDHKILKERNKAPYVEITGRSFETVLERRASVKTTVSPSAVRGVWTETAAKESDAAFKAMRVVLGDFQQYQAGVEVLPIIDPAVSTLDGIPEVSLILPADYSTGVANTYEIKPGELYSTVIELININNHGLKSVRPAPGYGSAQIGIEIYNGADLTADVVFDARFDQFDKGTYLLTEQGSKNVAYVYDINGSAQVLKTVPDPDEPSGLDRSVLLIDAVSDTSLSTGGDRTARALVELYKYNALALFDGEISDQVAAGYNIDYFLGDIIRLDGEYGLSQSVRVVEFIRSADSSGSRTYPTFQAIY